jgi:hypothetical protein
MALRSLETLTLQQFTEHAKYFLRKTAQNQRVKPPPNPKSYKTPVSIGE